MFKPTGACDRNTGTDANDHGSSDDADESNGVRTLGFEASLYPIGVRTSDAYASITTTNRAFPQANDS